MFCQWELLDPKGSSNYDIVPLEHDSRAKDAALYLLGRLEQWTGTST